MTWPLVGRVAVLRDLNRIRDRSLPAGVLIAGDAGVGKTRLLGEFADDAASSGWAVEWVMGAVSTASVPLGALAQLVPERLLGALDPVQFLAAMREALLSRYEGQPLLVAVDDVPRLDAASAEFVAQVAALGYCLVACTARSEESLPPPIEVLVKDQLVERVELGPLADSDVETLIRSDLDGEVDPAAIARIVRLAEGNPLFLRELLADGVDSGSLRVVEGRWVLEEPFGDLAGLRRLMAGRIGKLSDAQRAGLEAVAVAEPLELSMVDGFLEDEALVDLERRGVIRIAAQGRRQFVEFVHPLFAETIGGETPVTRRRSIAADLGRAISNAGARRRDDTLRLAIWYLDSGAAASEATLLAAAQFANVASDHALAERIARSAFDAKGSFAAGLELADAVSKQGRADEAERLFIELAAVADGDDLRVALVMRQAENAFLRAGDPDRATGLLEEARATVSVPANQMMLDVHLTLLLAFKPDPKAAFEKAAELIEQPNAPEEAVLEATTVLQLMALWLCDFPTVYRTTKQGLDLVATADYPAPNPTARLLIDQYTCQTYDGRVEEAVRGLSEGYHQAITPPIDDFCSIWATNLSAALAISGQVLDAVEVGRSGVLIGDRSDVAGHRAGLAGLLAVVAGQARDKATVDFALRKLEAAPIFTPPAGAWTPRARAWQHALGGDTSRAAQLAVEAGEAALNDDIPLVASWAFYDAIQFGHAELVVEHLRDIARNTTAVTINAYAEHASALVAVEPEALEKVAAGYQNRAELLYAATTYLQAGQLYRDQGRDHAAARAGARARQLETQLPPEVLTYTPTDLTQRETEIVNLAVQGLTSRQIADRLYVSVRTVDNHLASAYTKLGVHSRDELARVL